jgi:NAD/NADP transhydrogenase alpha subunit
MKDEISLIRPGSTFISFVYPGQNQDLVKQLAEKKINLFGMSFY